jgi:AraC-like DNA-binding protein
VDIYLYQKEFCEPDRDYCVEFHYNGDDSIAGGGALWVDGLLQDSSYSHNSYRRGIPADFHIGTFTGWGFKNGEMVLDDVAVSRKRIGPVPAQPQLQYKPDQQTSAGQVPEFHFKGEGQLHRYILQISRPGFSWFQNTYSSGEVPCSTYIIQPDIQLESGHQYVARMRLKNSFDNWSPWSRAVTFNAPESKGADSAAGYRIKDVWFTLPDKSGAAETIISGQWYDLHVQGAGDDLFKKVKGIDVLLCHYSNATSSLYNGGREFYKKHNYFFTFMPGSKTIWSRYTEGHGKLMEFSGQKHDYVDDSENQYEVRVEESYLKARIRLAPDAFTGPWMIHAGFKAPGASRISVYKKVFNVCAEERIPSSGTSPLLPILIGAGILGLIFILRKFRKADHGQSSMPADIEISAKSHVERAIHVIEQNIKDAELDMEKVAKMINISRKYLSKQFKSETGKSFPEYLNSLRLQKSKELLEKSNLRISEIAYELGYSSPEYFNKVFRKAENCSPSEYKSKKASK